jgi:uncharacterized protein (TIGR03086 family)
MEKKNLHPEMAAAATEAARVVNGVHDNLDAVTPCGDWDLRTLLNHTILWTSYSAERRAHGESVAADLMDKDFTADPGFRAGYAAQIDKAVQAWSDPATWEGDIDVMGNATPRADVAAMLIMEMALHGWDVARATGQDYALDDAAAEVVLATVEAQAELFRKYEGFADAVPLPEANEPEANEPEANEPEANEQSAFDRALSLSGRDPHWKPAS